MAIQDIQPARVGPMFDFVAGTNVPGNVPSFTTTRDPVTGQYTVTLNDLKGATGASGSIGSAPDGTAGSPGVAFSSGGGLFHIGSGVIGISDGTSEVARFANGFCGINFNNPAYPLHVFGDIHADAGSFLGESGNLETTPNFTFRGDDDTGMYRAGANIIGFSANAIRQARIGATGVLLEGATGGFKGAGTINTVGCYDDDTLLSCYVFDQILDGKISLAKWDAKVPDYIKEGRVEAQEDPETGQLIDVKVEDDIVVERQHDDMRKFRARIGTYYDPLTLDGYARHWKEKRHLTSMPNEETFDPETGMSTGAWVQRLIETVEIQAVLIEKLNERTKWLESILKKDHIYAGDTVSGDQVRSSN